MNAVVERKEQEIAARPATPMDMLAAAMERGIDIEQLKMLQEMHRDHEANEARKAFATAMNSFRSEDIVIVKKKLVEFGTTKYHHATLAQVVAAAIPHMSKYGLSHRWETKQENGQITVTCIITHELGHSQTTTLSAAPDQSGGKNSIQAVGSTVSYLERYTFLAATGLAAADMDDDGKGAEKPPTITEKQADELARIADEVGADMEKYLKFLKLNDLAEMSADYYDTAVKWLEKKRK